MPPPIRILFLAANPTDATRLQLAEEFREIRSTLASSEHRDRFTIRFEPQVLRHELLPLLVRDKPTIVHFSGHGTPEDELMFIGDDEQSAPVTAEALETLFAELEDSVKVVVLNACFSDEQAEVITKSVPCAIGMRSAISDEAAIEFARTFYMALGEGSSVQDAYDLAVGQFIVMQLPEEDTPVLVAKDGTLPSDEYPGGPGQFEGIEGWWEIRGFGGDRKMHEYSVEIKKNEGYALTTDSTFFQPGDLVLRITKSSGLLFTADGMDPGTGKWGGLVGRLSEDGRKIRVDAAGGGSAEMRRL